MGFFDRLSRLIRSNANAVVGAMEDPAKILDQSVADMQADLIKLRQAVATAIASQKRIQNQAEQAEAQAKTWYERAELALKKGEEDLAREALSRRKTCQDTATALNTQLQSQAGQVDQLKKSLVALESKIAEHSPGAVSQGCKSGKDRGSIVDASTKALLHEMVDHGGHVPDHVLRPGWMLTRAREDTAFRNDLSDIFLANYELQKANTGFKGYITVDFKVALLGGENYIDRLAHLVFDDKSAIKAGSGMIKS